MGVHHHVLAIFLAKQVRSLGYIGVQHWLDAVDRKLRYIIRSAKAGDLEVSLGDIIAVTPSDEDSADVAAPQMAMIQALWQAPKAKMMQVRVAAAFMRFPSGNCSTWQYCRAHRYAPACLMLGSRRVRAA